MGADAVKDLRAWQREQASAQERALRTARKAKQLIDDLEEKRLAALDGLSSAVSTLEKAGLTRDQCASLLDLTPEELARTTSAARRGTSNRQLPSS
jgi:hypothetical protein